MADQELTTAALTEMPETYAMPEGMHVIGDEPQRGDIPEAEPAAPVQTPQEQVWGQLLAVHGELLPRPAGLGVEYDGFPDDKALAKVKAKAMKTIRENINRLYKTKVKKVAIIGTAMTYKDAPFDDPSWEIWGLNDHWNMLPRATRWFEAQDRDHCSKAPVSHNPAMTRYDWLKKCPIPLYMPDHYDDAPMSIAYPLEQVQDYVCDLDPMGRNYFTNSVAYMIALAIYEGFDVIHLYGVDMAVGSEFNNQRPSCEFWCGIAKGKGIELYIPVQSDLLKTMEMYGMVKGGKRGQKDPFMRKLIDRKKYQQEMQAKIQAEIAKRQNEIQQLSATKFQYDGSIADIDQTLKVWGEL